MFKFTAKFLVQADEHTLNGFDVMSLDEFVHQGDSSHTAAEDDEESDEKDEKKDKSKSKKDNKTEKKDDKKEDKKPSGDSDFLGARHREIPDDEMQEYLGRSKNKEKTKTDPYTMPYVHGSNIKIVDGEGDEYDLNALRSLITKRPSVLLKKNEKMQHSDGSATQYYNIGLPALKGLAVNEKTGKFIVVDTCPGSGICKTFCYAMKGSYVMFKDVSMIQTQTLNFLLNQPDKFKARLKAEIATAIASADDETQVVIRWHDAGDFFSPQYMSLAFDVASAFPDNTFYAYTKMADVAKAKKPKNFIINFSEGALPSEQKRVDLTKIKHSVVVPKELFTDLIAREGRTLIKDEQGATQFKSEAAWKEFKKRLVEKYKIPENTILIYSQYMEMKRREALGKTPNYWNVVVPPGGGDTAANDPLVHGSYLMFH